MTGGKRSMWMSHVKKTMKAHKGMKLKDVLKVAKKTYKKGMKGGNVITPAETPMKGGAGGVASTASPLVGGRRRGSRKSRKGTRGSRKH